MMDQNRCLLDVIDDPQLLQSFLESESNADLNHQINKESSIPLAQTEPISQNVPPLKTPPLQVEPALETPPVTTITSIDTSTITTSNTPSTSFITSSTDFIPEPNNVIFTTATTNSSIDTSTTSTSLSSLNTTIAPPTTTHTSIAATADTQSTIETTAATAANFIPATDFNTSSITTTPLPPATTPVFTTTTTSTTFVLEPTAPIFTTAVTSTISIPSPATTPILTTIATSTIYTPSPTTTPVFTAGTNSTNSSPVTTTPTFTPTTTPTTFNSSPTLITTPVTGNATTFTTEPTLNTTPVTGTATTFTTGPTLITTPVTSTATTTSTSAATITPTSTKPPTKNAASTTKRAPKKSTSTTSKGKNNKSSTTTSSQLSPRTTPQTSVQPQFTTPPQQQILFQANNNGIRQPAILAPSTMGAPLANIGQQQRVIQIQTANGPMYFAIAPGPAINSSPMMNQQQQQARLGTPMVAGQTLAIPNRSNLQQQNIVLPSSQPMVMPRITNQLILNRPINSAGQMMPGQQQFIQIQTPNGPMLLALPPQQTQPINNAMIDYNSQLQKSQHQPQQQPKAPENIQRSPTKQVVANSPTKSSNNLSSGSKPGLDLADLLLDCGILPEERQSTQSPSGVKTSQSPSLFQINSPMPQVPQISSSISSAESYLPNSSSHQQQQPIQQNFSAPMQQHPIRITIGPDGQMIMQHPLYNSMRPPMPNTLGQPHLTTVNSTTTNMIPSSSPIMTSTMSNPTNIANDDANSESKKTTIKGKGSATKRSRSKKSDLDKFPILKTPKIAQQQQQQQQQQHQQQQHMETVTVVPISALVDQNKRVLGVSDGNSNVAQLAGGQHVSLAKIVTAPTLIQPSPLVQGNLMQQTSIPQQNNITNTSMGQTSDLMMQNSQLVSVDSSTNSNSTANSVHQNSTITSLTSSNQQLTSSGNVTTNSFIQKTDKSGTVESNPHISSSMMSTISLPIDSSKVEHNGFKPNEGQQHTIKAVNNVAGITTLIIHQPQQQLQLQQKNSQHQNQMTQVQQVTRPIDLRAQSILNQLGADQNAALNPQTKQSFRSFEDACKRLLRYHVFDTQIVNEEQIKKVDEIFKMAAESLISRKQAIYDKYRLLILKQSMKTVPAFEEVMLDQIFISDEQSYLKKEKELFREYEAQLERVSLNEADSKLDSKDDYFGFGDNSPKQNNRDDLDGSANSREVDEWLLTDKWGKSRYPSVPDSEAATAIESILNEELT